MRRIFNWKTVVGTILAGSVSLSLGIGMYVTMPHVTSSGGALSIALAADYNGEKLPPTLDIKFNPTGTHIDEKGQLKIRFDFYPTEDNESYEKFCLYLPVYTEEYPGKLDEWGYPVDPDEYQKWEDALPHEWVVNPCLNHFVKVPPDITLTEIDAWLKDTFYSIVTDTIDYACTQEDAIHLLSPYMVDKSLISTSEIAEADKDTVITAINTRLADFEITKETSSGEGEIILPQSIDMGNDPIDRPNYGSNVYIVIVSENPANASGTIDSFEVWCHNSATNDPQVATCYETDTDEFSSRDYEDTGNWTSGYNIFTGLDIDVETGDYLGHNGDENGTVDRTNGSGSVWYVSNSGLDFPISEQAMDGTYGAIYSTYATGTESATPDISNTPTTWAIGTVYPNTTYWSNGSEPSWPLTDGDAYFTVTNNSGFTVDLSWKGSNFTGGVGWTLAGTPAENTVQILVFIEGDGSGDGTTLTTGDQELVDGLADSADIDWELKFLSATSHTDAVGKTGTVTITAVAD